MCNVGVVETELHFVFRCPALSEARKSLLEKYAEFDTYFLILTDQKMFSSRAVRSNNLTIFLMFKL